MLLALPGGLTLQKQMIAVRRLYSLKAPLQSSIFEALKISS